MDTNDKKDDVNKTGAENQQINGIQSRTDDDITNSQGDGLSIGNEDYEEDGGDDLRFGEAEGIDEDEDRESPLRRSPGGGATSDGTNEGYGYDEDKNNQERKADKLSIEFKKRSSFAGRDNKQNSNY
jgi:hypothetical protein